MAQRAALPSPLRRVVGSMADRARKGQPMGAVLVKAGALPLACRCLMALAEETNELIPTLKLMATQFQRETEALAEQLPRTVGVFFLLTAGLLVGLSVWAMYSPLGFFAFL